MKIYTDAELAAAASAKLSESLGYEVGEPFQDSSASSFWTLGPSNNFWFRRDEWNDVQIWCRHPGQHWACKLTRRHLLRLLNEPCECGAPWCAECAAEAKAIRQRSLEAEANFIAGGP